jgi:hypothetical protein
LEKWHLADENFALPPISGVELVLPLEFRRDVVAAGVTANDGRRRA